MDRGTIAFIGWTRRSRLHVASIYNGHEGDAGHEENSSGIREKWQAYLAEIASVPWILGETGTWNQGKLITTGTAAKTDSSIWEQQHKHTAETSTG